jgi:hypothetical protein
MSPKHRNRLGWLWWPLIAVVLIGTLWAGYVFVTDAQFREGALSNFLATIAGVVAGIPIAIWLARQQQSEQEQAEVKSREQEKQQRQRKILSLIVSELEVNQKILNKRVEVMRQRRGIINVPGVKNDLWAAFSDGGEIEWLDDIELLAVLSEAYYHIRWITNLEMLHFDPHFFDQIVRSGQQGVEHTIRGIDTVENMERLIPVALDSVDKALNYANNWITEGDK